jgi:hypothetical protein
MNPQALVEAIAAIESAQDRWPSLGWEGYYPLKTRDGLRELPQQNPYHFPEQVATAIAFLRLCIPTKSPRGSVRAYELKHWAEDWGAANGMESYVPTGAVIIAALHLALPIRKEKKETLPHYHPSLPLNDIVWIGVSGYAAATQEVR